ncbi:flagellin, partial [Rhodobacteraceae bacterium]|nr:flagellin [Paracoccaceae bacterium]
MAQAAASSVTRDMETAMHRLSTGKRLNAAADDAAGVAISSRLDSTVRGLNQSIRNALDAQALIDTAEGGMQETETILQRIRELSIQASNDTNSADDRANLNAEAQSLLSEIDRISSSTTWAGQSLLDGTFTDKSFQVGTGTMASDQLVTSISGVSSGYLGLSGSSGSTITTPQKVGSEFQVNTYTSGNQTSTKIPAQSVAALTNGDFVVTWDSNGQDGSGKGVYAQRFSADGTPKGSEFHVSSFTPNDQVHPTVTALSDGGFVVTYMSYGQDGRSNNLTDSYAQKYDSSGNKVGAEFLVHSYTSSFQHHPIVTSLDGGKFLVTWQSNGQDGSEYGIYGQMFDQSNSKIGSEFLVNTTTSGRQHHADVTKLENGSFVITWVDTTQQSSTDGIFGQRYDSTGTKIGSEFEINTHTTSDQNEPAVASLADGGFVVTWQSDGQDGDNNGIFGQRYDSSGAKVGSEFQVNTQAAGSQEYSTVIGLSDGGFLTAWSSSSNHADGSGYGIYGQRYDSSGNTVGDEFQINTYVSGDQDRISLEQLSDGSIVASWTSDGQDGDGDGIFAQIFDLGATNVDLTTMSNSQSAISLVDSALQSLNSQRASLGALSNRLDHIVANNTNAATNVAKSLGRIQDADFAAES